MNTSFGFEYKVISHMLTLYYMEKYPDCKVNYICKKDEVKFMDSDGFMDERLELNGYLEYSKKIIAFGKETELSDCEYFNDDEVKKDITTILNMVLEKEGNDLEVIMIEPDDDDITVTVGEKKVKKLKKTK